MAIVQRGSVLVAADAAVDDFFSRVALSSDGAILAVGAWGWEGAAADQGGVYVYDWSGTAWVQRGSVLVAADAAAGDFFGKSVALSSDGAILAVGANAWEGAADDQGGVYIYDWSGTAWVQRGSVLVAVDAEAGDFFGISVALSSTGAILAVGADGWEGAASNQGGAYIYDWNGSAWVQRGSVLVAADAAANDSFGQSVALSSDGAILAVGAGNWEGAAINQGGVYIYDWSGSAWVQRGSVLVAADAAVSDFFGISVALSSTGTILAVGADGWEGALSSQGGVYVYDWSGTAWVQRGSVLVAADAAAGDNFSRVALSSDGATLAVGAERWEGAAAEQGGVYVYDDVGNLKGTLSSGGALAGTIGSFLTGILNSGGSLFGALTLNSLDYIDEVSAEDGAAPWQLSLYSLVQAADISSAMDLAFDQPTSDTAAVTETFADSIFTMYLEAADLSDILAGGANTIGDLADSAALIDVIQQAIDQIVSDSASGTETLSLGAAMALVDVADAVATQTSTYDSVMLVAELIASIDAFNAADGFDITESAVSSEAYTARVTALVAMLEAAQAVDTNTALVHVMQSVTDSAAGVSTISSDGSLLSALLTDSVLATIRLNIGGELFTGWVLNADSLAASEYQFADLNFNSACKHGTRYLMAADDGIYQFTNEVGVETVMTYIKTGKMDFGSDKHKRVINSYMVYSATGQMMLKVTTSENGQILTHAYQMAPFASNETTDARRFDIGKGLKSRYWQFEIVGDGVDCEFDEIGMLPVVLSRRI